MPFPNRFVKVVASGGLSSGDEIWSTSWSMADPNVDNDAEQPDPEPFAQPIRAWFTRASSSIGADATLELVKVNLVGPDGLYVSKGATFQVEIPGVVRGANTGSPWPNQCSMAVSLLSERRRGPGSHGRFYPPLTYAPVGGGTINPATALQMADSASLLIQGLEDAGKSGLGSPVLQVVNASAVGSGRFDKVTRVRVGVVPDTIRKRRSALFENYQESALPTDPAAQG